MGGIEPVQRRPILLSSFVGWIQLKIKIALLQRDRNAIPHLSPRRRDNRRRQVIQRPVDVLWLSGLVKDAPRAPGRHALHGRESVVGRDVFHSSRFFFPLL